MQARFIISADPARKLIRISMGGFFALADIELFQATLTAKISELACAPNEHLTLCDVRDMKIQTQEIVGAFSRLMADDEIRSRRLAFLTGSSLARMQTQRLTGRPGVAYFKEVKEAERWLFNAGDPVIMAVQDLNRSRCPAPSRAFSARVVDHDRAMRGR